MNQPHPMLFPARELLRREVDAFKEDRPFIREHIEYMRALLDLCDLLYAAEEPVELTPTPGFHLRREDGGHVVYGWYFVLLASHGGKIRRQECVSFHYYRWRARRAGNAWLKRAHVVSSRISSELSQALEGAR